MGGNFSYESKAMAWQDTAALQNPRQLAFSWANTLGPESFERAISQVLSIPGGGSVYLPITAPTGLIGSANSPTLTVSANAVKAGVYRFTPSVSALFVPVANLTGATSIAISTRPDGNYDFVLSGANITLPQGGRIFIPGTATGDTVGPFSEANVGNWRILSIASNNLSFVASPMDSQSPVAESVGGVVSPRLQAYDVTPDIGWQVYGNQGPWNGSFEITGLTSEWFEVSVSALPWQLPGSYPSKAGVTQLWYVAQAFPKFIRIEAGAPVEIIGMWGPPNMNIAPHSSSGMGWIEMSGAAICPVPLQAVNNGVAAVNVNVFVLY
jgi:hypothetical protein